MSETPNPDPSETARAELEQWKAESRKWESRAKENKAQIDALQKQLEESQTHASQLETQVTELNEKVTGFEQEKELAALIKDVAKAKGVPAEALKGTTEDELNAHADVLKTILQPSAPVIDGQAKSPDETPVDPMREFARNLFKTD